MNLWSPDIYAKAWEFATLAHQNQTYGGRTDGVQINYINHISSVAMEVINIIQQTHESLNTNLAIQCALLHDVIEDTNHSYEDIKKEFGAEVAEGVIALTKNDKIPLKLDRMIDSLNRIKLQPKEIWIVKIADRICNLYHPPFYWNNERIQSYITESKIILKQLKPSSEVASKRLEEKIIQYHFFLKS